MSRIVDDIFLPPLTFIVPSRSMKSSHHGEIAMTNTNLMSP